jgi:hypothetical protein
MRGEFESWGLRMSRIYPDRFDYESEARDSYNYLSSRPRLLRQSNDNLPKAHTSESQNASRGIYSQRINEQQVPVFL